MYPKLNAAYLNFVGMSAIPQGTSLIKTMLRQFLKLICLASQLSLIILSLADVFIRDRFNIVEVAINILNAGVCFSTAFRLGYFYLNDQKVSKTINDINDTFVRSTSTGLEEINMDADVKYMKKITRIWTTSLTLMGVLIGMSGLFLSPIIGKSLPFPAWYPYDWKNNYYFIFTSISQALTEIVSTTGHCSSDIFYANCLYLTAAQFHLIGHEAKNLLYTALLLYGIPKEEVIHFKTLFNNNDNYHNKIITNLGKVEEKSDYYKILHIINSENFQKILEEELIKIIRKHQKLLKFVREFTDFISTFAFGAIGCAMFYLIFICFTLVNTDDSSLLFAMGQYFLVAFMSIYIYTYFAQVLIDGSEYLNDAIYECPWYLSRKGKFRSIFAFFQAGVFKPIIVKAGPFIKVNIGTFLVAIKTAFSYLTVLTSVTDE